MNLRCTTSASPSSSSVAVDIQMGTAPSITVRKNICYIACGIALRDGEKGREVLLTQEAHKNCRGHWYMPAGRVERGETIEDGCKREFTEETGMEGTVEALLCVEVQGAGWYRMAFAVHIVGGELIKEPNAETMGAGWHSIATLKSGGLPLRGKDFLRIVVEAERFADWKEGRAREGDTVLQAPIVVQNVNQPGLFAEFVILNDSLECLVHHHNQKLELDKISQPNAFPSVEFGFDNKVQSVIDKMCSKVLKDDERKVKLTHDEVTAVWCLPMPASSTQHGIRLRIVCRLAPGQRGTPSKHYHWIKLDRPEILSALHLQDWEYRPKLMILH